MDSVEKKKSAYDSSCDNNNCNERIFGTITKGLHLTRINWVVTTKPFCMIVNRLVADTLKEIFQIKDN